MPYISVAQCGNHIERRAGVSQSDRFTMLLWRGEPVSIDKKLARDAVCEELAGLGKQ
jgi:hypothetical protein